MPVAAEPMSKVDTAWLRMDSDVNLMVIVGVWLLQPRLPFEALLQRVQERLLKYPRFLQRVQHDAVGTQWVPDAAFDVQHHVLRQRLVRQPGQTERAALQALVGELAMQPLPAHRPLWQFQLIEDYEGGSALVARIHHCMADGVALMSVMLSITDGGLAPPQRHPRAAGEPGDAADGWMESLLKPALQAGARVLATMEAAPPSGGAHEGSGLPPLLQRPPLARLGGQVLGDALALALLAADSPTRFKGRPGGRKVVAWGEPLPLADVKAVGKGLGASVNDVLLGCVAGALGGYLRDQGEDPKGQELRAMVPVNLRPPQEAWKLGNRFGLAPLCLPIGLRNPVQRVELVRARMNALKESLQPVLAYALLAASGVLTPPAQAALLGLFSSKATAVVTNVPGPMQPLALCGVALKQSMFWVPASGDIGVGVSVLSYGGGVQFGLITDERLCADPQAVVERFAVEFERLLLLTLMLPWGASNR
jgi:diacylglycerol O-acyltransferase / wax synthase